MSKFEFKYSPLGACLITPFIAPDNRGEFVKDFNSQELREGGILFTVHEVLNVRSKKGVLRGMHFQTKNPQAKIVRCLRGCIIDVIVDARPGSVTFGEYEMYELSDEKAQSLYVPEGFAHGYLVLQDDTHVQYYCSDVHNADADSGIHFLDPDVNIDWPWERIGGKMNVVVSNKDRGLQSLLEWKVSQIGDPTDGEREVETPPTTYKCICCQQYKEESEIYGITVDTRVEYTERGHRLFTHLGYGERRARAANHICRDCSNRLCAAPKYKRREEDAEVQ